MQAAIAVLADTVPQYVPVILPAATVLVSTISAVNIPLRHSLLVASISWILLWIYSVSRVGIFAGAGNSTRRKFSWAAGALLALAHVCERAAWDKEGLLWFKLLLPVTVCLILEADVFPKPRAPKDLDSPIGPEKPVPRGYNRAVAITIALLAATLSAPYLSNTTAALGLCYVLGVGLGFILLENALLSNQDKDHNVGGFVLANGSFSRLNTAAASQDRPLTALRDTAAAAGLLCSAATYVFETFRTDVITYEPLNPVIAEAGESWKTVQEGWIIVSCIWGVVSSGLEKLLIFYLIHKQGALRTSLAVLTASFFGWLHYAFSLWNFLLGCICAGASLLFVYDPPSSTHMTTGGPRLRLRTRTLLCLLIILSLIATAVKQLRRSSDGWISSSSGAPLDILPPGQTFAPLQLVSRKTHPVDQLMKSAESDFQELLLRQSKTLAEAVAEYRRRYQIPPPPHFDKWFEYAQKRGVQLIDEYDTIHNSLLPFWGLQPSTIRSRVREAIGFQENSLIPLLIRDGSAVKIERGAEWQQQATLGMIKEFVQFLPDMDIAFNIHDEPRVVVPSDKLSYLVDVARNKRMPAAFANTSPKNKFSSRPEDMNDGKRIEEVKFTRFNHFAHQATWTHSKASCAVDSPARSFEEVSADNLTSYALGDLGFVYNSTAFSDICMSPSLKETFGFFDRPNAYNLVQDLFPVFSQSKISSYQDILYPSPWYWFGKVSYDEERDTTWDNKTNSLWWRGSTTGGFSRNGGWRRQHRQHMVRRLNAPDTAKILAKSGDSWQPQSVQRSDFEEIIDVKFSHIGQCDPDDCDAQKEFFTIAEPADQQDAWKYRHLLDMDGNAFSGRFYAFLQSRSLVYKMAVFQEWHMEWLKPWVHYIPLSLRSDETLETVRYFALEEEGMKKAPEVAMQGREWAGKVLRNEDFEAWFFRLLLEYGRIIDDNRENIGYPGP